MGWEQAREDKVETQEYELEGSLTCLIFPWQNSDTKVYFLKTCRFSVRSLQFYDEMSIFHWCCDSGCTRNWLCFSEISLFASVTPWRQPASFIVCILWSAFQPSFWEKPSPSPTAQQKWRISVHMLASRPELQGLPQLSAPSQSPGQIREETDGHLGSGPPFNSGSESISHPPEEKLALLRAEAGWERRNRRADVRELWLWQVIANRLCLVSTDTYGRCWHRDRWLLVAPSLSL